MNKNQSVRISPHASAKVMFDLFPSITNEQMLIDTKSNTQDLNISAGALCLYAATLLTKVHETEPVHIKCDYKEREQCLINAIKNTPKHSSLTELQVKSMAHNLIQKDIRNSFAHGNFEIDYNTDTKQLNFILKPRRKDFIIDKPIIISKEALFEANQQYTRKLGIKFLFLNHEQLNDKIKNNFGNELKEFLLPVDMLRLADNYINNDSPSFRQYQPTDNRYWAIYYPLLVSQLTYEQDEYYNIFKKDSNIFEKISHIRNAISHNGFAFDNKTLAISHTDRDSTSIDTLQKSVRMLKILRDHKNLVKHSPQLHFTEEDTQSLIEKTKSFFDNMFVDNGYEQEIME